MTTATLLGDPLARVQERISTRRQQTAGVAAMLAVSGAALASGHRGALAVVAACVVAAIGFAASLVMLASDRRARILEVIAVGRSDMPLPDVQRERRRLLTASHRAELAGSLHTLAEEAPLRPACPHPGGPLYTPRVITACAAELHAIARRLEEDPIGISGVALTELLLTAHDSPLYGADATRLCHQLGRISFALQSLADSADPPRCRRTP